MARQRKLPRYKSNPPRSGELDANSLIPVPGTFPNR
jgi:hypothetical protein